MLTSQSLYKASVLAEQFDAAGVVLKPLGGSPLHHIAEACRIGTDMVGTLDNGQVVVDLFRVEQTANAKEGAFDRSRHDYAMADFVNLGADAVRKALYVARNHVAPRINELLELVTMRLASAPVSELSRIRISEDEDCPAIYGPSMRKLVDQYANYHNGEPALSINGPELSTADILKYVETGIASIDEELVAWAASLPEYRLQETYRNFFTIRNGASDDRGFYGRVDKSVVTMVLVYCIARHLLENDVLLEGVSLGLKEYRAALTALMAQSAHLLTIQMEQNDASIMNGNMVRSITAGQINVFPPVYREWLKQKGDTDILYGMAVSGDQKFTINAIVENADKYASAWANYSSLVTARDSMVRMNFLREQCAIAYESILAKPDDEGNVPNAQAIKAEMDCFRDVLRTMGPDDADDLHAMVRKLVCRGSFCDTPAEIILTKMDEEAKKNPNLSAREAGAVATLWYISSWVASLVVPTNA